MINLILRVFYNLEYFDTFLITFSPKKSYRCDHNSSSSRIYYLSNQPFDRFKLNLFQLFYFIKTCNYSQTFYQNLLNNLITQIKNSNQKINLCNFNSVVINVKIIENMPLDRFGSKKILRLIYIRINMEENFSCLSTLGGAYSSLGDSCFQFAIKAGEISLKQFHLAMLWQDPIVIAKSLIYMVYSLCQRGFQKKAKLMLKKCIFPYLQKMKANKTCDTVLKNMYKAACFKVTHS